MKLFSVVEGAGEVSALPVLLRRLMHEHAGAFTLVPAEPLRRKQHEFFREQALRSAVRLALVQPDCAAVLVLFDGEDELPCSLGPRVSAWAKEEAGGVPCEVVVAYREYETWFLCALESLRGRCRIHPEALGPADPELRRDAKGWLETFMPRGASYAPTQHQAALTAALDLAAVHQRSRSFRKLTKAVGELLRQTGHALPDWPPPGWATSLANS